MHRAAAVPGFQQGRMRWIAAAALGAAGCGGGAATLHPAHVLPTSRITAGAGVSGHFAFDPSSGAAIDERSLAAAPGSEQAFFESAAARALLAPGVAPWVGARAGLGDGNEAGVTYTGRAVRVDGRHAFEQADAALSVGLGLSALLSRPQDTPDGTPHTGRFTGATDSLNASGWGLDVPIIAGYRSQADLVQAWAGLRGGYEQLSGFLPATGDAEPAENGSAMPAGVSARRVYGGGLVGLAVGIHPIWVAIQLDAAYQALQGTATFEAGSGEPSRLDGRIEGITLTPSGAIIGKF